MSIAAAILLIAVGAILKFATNFHVESVNMDTVGVILMIAGAAGLLLTFIHEATLARRRRVGDPAAMEERREVREPPPRY
jgi:hypothetical protein